MSRHIVLIAGEPSGDALGGSLIHALKDAEPGLRVSGVGGARMAGHGVDSLFPMSDLSVMGVFEVLPKLPLILRRINETVEYIKEVQPDIVVTIDSPDFVFRVVKKLREDMGDAAPRLIHYVAPSVWAWREERAAKIAQLYDGLICLFDFEPEYFLKEGLPAIAVGHPMVEKDILAADGAIYRDEVGISLREMTIGILMGSRAGEIARHGPLLSEAANRLARKIPGEAPHLIVPTLPQVEDKVWQHLKSYPGPVHITQRHELKWHAFKAIDVAMAVSGTVALELAVLDTPHLIAYKINPLTHFVFRRFIKTPYAHLVNIMLDRRAVPEFIQDKAVPEKIAEEALALLIDQRSRKRQTDAFAEIRPRLGFGDPQTPSQKAAAFILST